MLHCTVGGNTALLSGRSTPRKKAAAAALPSDSDAEDDNSQAQASLAAVVGSMMAKLSPEDQDR